MARKQNPIDAFNAQRYQANRRGIDFRLKYDEWFALWEPHWDRRETDNLVMCRTGDTGAYELGNVRIDTQGNNLLEQSALCKARANAAKKACVKSLTQLTNEYQIGLIKQALELENFNVTNASLRLGISFRRLRYLIGKLRVR